MKRAERWVRVVVGLLAAAVLPLAGGACGVRSARSEQFPELGEYAGREVTDVEFVGAAPFPEDSLQALIETHPTHCGFLGIPVCIPGLEFGEREGRLNPETLSRDASRLTLFFRRSGFFGTQVRPVVEPVRGQDDEVRVTFLITRGEEVVVDSLRVEGTEGLLDPDSLARELPLRVGERFDLGKLSASADTVRGELLSRGHAYAAVLRNYTVDTLTDRARAWLSAVPGPRVLVDSIVVEGAEKLGRGAALRQLTFGKGEVLRSSDLVHSQRNLYSLELVQFATVEVAPDSLQASPGDSARATVLVRVSEGPVHLVEAAVGYGTVECLRTEARWVSRSFGGGARRLALSGSLSKIGLGAPLDLGLEGSVCQAFEGDPFADELDYAFTADLTQPWFVSARNQLTLSAHGERQSEPAVFQREAVGARLSLLRRVGLRSALTSALDVERGRTVADPVMFCFAFQVCQETDIGALGEPRWRNTLASSLVRDRTNAAIDPSDGSILRSSVTWATRLLGSELSYVRLTAEGSLYRPVRPGWVAAGYLRLGSFLGTASLEPGANFLPPEERFFAGGSTGVRGFERNGLGPRTYIADSAFVDAASGEITTFDETFVPIGGTAMAVASVELRMPSPFLREHLRLVAFVDAGVVGREEIWEAGGGSWRVTPGAGFRMRTPVGPIRLDAAYNPYGPLRGPLFVRDPADPRLLVRFSDRYAPESGGFFDRIRLHLAVGQAF